VIRRGRRVLPGLCGRGLTDISVNEALSLFVFLWLGYELPDQLS
jgi:hypothetical protein